MAYTKEEIEKERQRRQRLKAGIERPEQSQHKPESGALKKYGLTGLVGAAQGTVNTGISALNLLSNNNPALKEAGVNTEIPHLKLEKYLPEDYSRGALFGGELLAPLGVAGKGLSMLNKTKTALKGLPGFGEKFARNAGLGYALGEQENLEGEHYGRGISAVLSGVVPGLANVTNKAVGKGIIDKFTKERERLSEQYSKLFDTAKEKGVDAVKNVLKEKDISGWLKDVPKNYRKSSERYFANPTLKNAQKAQSDLGGYAAELRNTKEIQGTLPDELNRRLEKLTSAREKMKEEIANALFNNKETSGLGWKYQDLTNKWAEKLGPYLDEADINKAVAGHISPPDLAKSLRGKNAHPFRKNMGHEHPELLINKFLAENLKTKKAKLGVGAGSILGTLLLEKKLSERNE